ncbi:MAG TPA: SDR family NAD(P)-dependent oxidoreductase, partial [Elusimicrobiota bacterium]|jgi:3-oxoacyl-[acyl-carrier protein] reductase|nr:SDR family NAD(P)-dependent oxidoreductase [Elusimicrobiota bacterium]
VNVLVTGSSRGIGRRLALAFGRAGHSVVVHYRARRGEAEAVLGELQAAGVRSDAAAADLADPLQCRELIDGVIARWGRLDVLVNNAGATKDRALLNMTPEEWRAVVDVNLSGAFYCLQAAAKHMVREKSGAVINVGSIVGVRGGVGCANYAAAKAGLLGLTKAAAKELGRFNVRVNAVLPGFHPTEMSDSLPAAVKDKVVAAHALGRPTDLADLEKLVVLLAELPSVSGQIFNVDSRLL